MKVGTVYEFIRGATKIGDKLQILDCFRLKATQALDCLGKIKYGDDPLAPERLHYVIETTYSCRVPMPKYVRNKFRIMREEDKEFFKEEFKNRVLAMGFAIAERGYQPYSGWVEIERTELDRAYDTKVLKTFYEQAYSLIKEFKVQFL
jgi:hypothetical protein